MSRLKQFQEKQKKLTRFQTLKSIFTSLFMTTAIVVVVAVMLPKSPEATINNIQSYTNEITYTVNITDEESAIISGTLKLRLECQSETFERSLDVGLSSGLFRELRPDTPYTLKVLADKGFGLEVLASEKIRTAPRTGGSITGYNINSDPEEFLLSYLVNYFISDPFDEYKSVQLRYSQKYPSEPEFLTYQTVSLSELNDEAFISSIYNENQEVHIILEAINQSDEVVELDSVIFHTPYQLHGSLGIDWVSNEAVSFYVWVEPIEGLDVEYELVLMQGDFVVDKQEVELPDYSEGDFHHMEEPLIVFENLYSEVSYSAVLYATYHHPYTKVLTEQVVMSEEFTTTPNLTYTVTIEDQGEYVFITIVIDDPKEFYDTGFYTLYEFDGESYWWTGSGAQQFQVFDDQKQVVLEVFIPTDMIYKLEIGIADDSQYYNRIITETLTNRQEG